jgi:hypothetical protein
MAPGAQTQIRILAPLRALAVRALQAQNGHSALLVDRNASWGSAVTFGCSDMPVVDDRQIIPRVRQATRGKHL